MERNRLRLNAAKTEVIWLGSTYHLQHTPITKGPLLWSSIIPSKHVRNLGVIFDGDSSMTAHVNKFLSVCFYHIRQLRLVRRSLDIDATHALVRALIHSRLDHCNGLLANLYPSRNASGCSQFWKLLLLSSFRCRDVRLWPMLYEASCTGSVFRKDSHTSSVCFRTSASTELHRNIYLSILFVSTSTVHGRTRLRSATAGLLVVPFVPSKTIGSNRSFAYCAPVAWNDLHKRSVSWSMWPNCVTGNFQRGP